MTEQKKERLRISCPVIVEGRYDRLRIESVADATVLATDGFGIFKQKEKQCLLRKLAEKTPLIVLTDSDGAGKVIRSHIAGMIPPERLIQLYIPRIPGTEKRKAHPSAEGTLGVEGMERDLLRDILAPYADGGTGRRADNPLSKTDLYLDGLTGTKDAARMRDRVAERFGLPPGMTPNALLTALRLVGSYEEYKRAVHEAQNETR